MTNRAVGIIGSAVCSVSVLCFAVSMIVGIFVNTLFLSCFASMFIALGFMLFMCAVSGSNKDNEKRACGNVSLVCAAIYVTLIFLVYFAECTTVNLSPRLDEKILSIKTEKHGKTLSLMLKIHGIFFPSCFLVPMFPLFNGGDGDTLTGTVLLLVWCAYFLPVCCLGFGYFRNKKS